MFGGISITLIKPKNNWWEEKARHVQTSKDMWSCFTSFRQPQTKPESCHHLIYYGGDKDVDSIHLNFFSFSKADGRPQARINKQKEFPVLRYCTDTFRGWGG